MISKLRLSSLNIQYNITGVVLLTFVLRHVSRMSRGMIGRSIVVLRSRVLRIWHLDVTLVPVKGLDWHHLNGLIVPLRGWLVHLWWGRPFFDSWSLGLPRFMVVVPVVVTVAIMVTAAAVVVVMSVVSVMVMASLFGTSS